MLIRDIALEDKTWTDLSSLVFVQNKYIFQIMFQRLNMGAPISLIHGADTELSL